MRKKISIFLFSLTLLGTIGCATESSNPNMTITPTVELSKSVVENEETNTTETPTPTKASSSVFLDKKQTETIKKTDGLCEQLEQVDASLQAEYNSFNRMLSLDFELDLYGQSLFCIDETTGVIYFSNQARDYYLYRLKDGEVQLAVAMPVKQIYTYQGSVYFMLESYDIYELEEMRSGDIYCYTPMDGTVQLVYEAGKFENSKEHRLTVNENGIYFSYIIEEETSRNHYYYYLPFGASEPMEDTEMTTRKGWNNYAFDYGSILKSRTKQEDGTRETIQLSNRRIRFCVKGDYLYSAERTYISCLNLKTGEEIKYDFLEVIKEHYTQKEIENVGYRLIEAFTVTETDIWAYGGMILYRLNLETKELSYCRICKDKNAQQPFYEIRELYTDGEQLYVTCCSFVEKKSRVGCLARIKTDTVENDGMYDVMMLEILVE